jgi:hypothetical protein
MARETRRRPGPRAGFRLIELSAEDWSQHRAERHLPEFPEISDGHSLRRVPRWRVLSFGPGGDEHAVDSGWPTPLQANDPTNGAERRGHRAPSGVVPLGVRPLKRADHGRCPKG